MKKTQVGIVGCGMISDAYFNASRKFPHLQVVACSDILPERARAKTEKHGVPSMSNDELFAMPEIEIVLNLTPPKVHSKIALDTLNAGKHAYSEKPFGVDAEDAAAVVKLAEKKRLRVGCAPDTFLGGGHQTARKLLDDGWIGKPLSGTAIVMGRGPEKWGHAPNFYDTGAGPMLDLGPYYMTALVNLLGPAKSVTAVTTKGFDFRTFGAEIAEEYRGRYKPYDRYPVNVTTHLTGVIEFQCGAVITVITSFDVIRHGHSPIEIYGSEGSMQAPDPNGFGGPVHVFKPGYADWQTIPLAFGYNENFRSIGVADMANALRSGRPHRVSGELANHVLDLMLSFDRSSRSGRKVELATTCSRPAPLPLGLEPGFLDD